MTIALHVHNVQTIHNVQRDSKLCKLILTENNRNHQSYNTITRKLSRGDINDGKLQPEE